MTITVSIVSHGHAGETGPLLEQLAECRVRRVIVTLNLPESQSWRQARWPFELVLIDNARPVGFGLNHNRAFHCDREHGASELFAVLNPDLRWQGDPFAPMLPLLAAAPRVGLVYPVQIGSDGQPQDCERLLPTPARLWARYRPGGNRRELPPGGAPEWVNAAFMLLRHEAFASVGGFDKSYHMYCEDVDLCLRLQLAGWRLARADGAVVEHPAQRASHRDARHLFWHLASLWRLWRSRAWQAWRLRAPGSADSTDNFS
ncbi:MAG: glycosyl transferase [Burkholderiaceae bacterium]|nr:glycosyl transferase [Burkholderiaceae bacterium]